MIVLPLVQTQPDRWVRSPLASLAVAAMLLLLFPADALAYIDPGTGSLAYQMALALLLGVGLILRRTWYKAIVFIGRLLRRGDRPPGPPPPSN